jgi:hydroxyacylglutathione hydrolase
MTKTKAVIVPVTPFQQNCTLLWCEVTKRAVVIDPGGDLPEVERAIRRAAVCVDKIWLTHGHVDHVAGATDLKTNLRVSIEGPHMDGLFLLQHVAETGRSYGMWNASNVTPDRWMEEGDQHHRTRKSDQAISSVVMSQLPAWLFSITNPILDKRFSA